MTTAEITLTKDQATALDSLFQFLINPVESVFVLSGYSGCGKSTLVHTFIDRLPGYLQTVRLIDPDAQGYEVMLTATTNKAAENLARITGTEAITIHSALALRVETDFRTNVTKLIPRNGTMLENKVLFIDEASYIDGDLLNYIFKRTRNCKIVFVGDPAQLTPVKSKGTPVFDAQFTGAALTQVVRQAEGNPIVDLSTKFRHTVNTGNWFDFVPDGHHVQRVPRDQFNSLVLAEFSRPDWKFTDSKVLGWTNKCVIAYNHMINASVTGDPSFQVGDYAVCNSFITVGKKSIKTDQMVQITGINEETTRMGVLGNLMTIDHSFVAFMPKSVQTMKEAIRKFRAAEDLISVSTIETEWIDLRSAFACTVNKAQGSTFDRVYIDLDDIGRCNMGDQIARMLYVAVSRAREQVVLTGDLV